MAEKICECITWIIDVARQLGRATEASLTEPHVAKDLAELSDYLLSKEVEKCLPTKEIRASISKAIEQLERGERAWDNLYDASHKLMRKTKEACG